MADQDNSEANSNDIFKSKVRQRMKSLWPEFTPAEGEVPPITILKEQAAVLGLKLKNLIEADVETSTSDYQRFLRHSLFLIAPVLDFYRYKLLEVEHSATHMYPVTIKQAMDDPASPNGTLENTAKDEGEFKDVLKAIFANEKTKSVIENLLAQSLAVTPTD